MAVNVLGGAFIRIEPKLVGFDGIAGQLRSAIDPVRIPIQRVGDGLRDAAEEAGQLGDQLGDAAGDAEDVQRRLADVEDAARRAEAGAGGLRDSLDEAGDAAGGAAERAESGWKGAIASIKSGIGTGIGIGITELGVKVAAAFSIGLAQGMESEAAADKLVAQLGASGERAAELGEMQARIYAANWGESLDDVGTAIKGVVQNIGDLDGAELETAATRALALAQTFDQDLNTVTAAAGQLLRTGLATSADQAFDIITAGMQSSHNKADDFLDTLNEYSTKFRDLGLDAQTATGLLSQGLLAGARDADIVADALKEFSIRAIDGSEATVGSFEALGVSARDMQARIAAGGPGAASALDEVLDRLRGVKDPAERSAIAVGLFGSQAEDLGDALYALDPSTAVAALGDVEGAAGRMAEQVGSNAAGSLETLKRTFMTKLGNLGSVILPPLISLATTITNGLEPAFRIAGVVVSGFITGLSALGSFLTGTAIPAMRDFAGWVSANQTPILIVASVITTALLPALIQAGVQATISAAKQVAAWVKTGAAATKNAVVQVGSLIASGAKWVWAGWVATASAVKQVAAWTVTGARAVAGAAVQVGALAMTGARWVWAGVQATISAARQAAAWTAAGVRASASVAIQVGALVATGARWVWAGAVATANAIRIAAAWLISMGPIGLIIAAIAGIVAVFVILWNKCDAFRNFWIAVWHGIQAAALFVWNWVKSNWPLLLAILTGPIGIAVGLIVKHWDTIKGAISAVFNWVKANWPLLLAIITGPIGLAVLAVVKNWDTIKAAGVAVYNWIVGLPSQVATALISIGQVIAAPFIAGWRIVSGWVTTAVGWYIALPGRVASALVSIGRTVAQPFINGWNTVSGWITTGVGWFIALPGRVGSAIASMARTLSQPFVNGWNTVSGGITTAVGWFTGMPGKVKSALSSIATTITSPFRSAFNAIARAWNSTVGRISFSIPDWVPILGGKSWSVPDIPTLAAGGIVTAAGWALVGDAGPELLRLPRGAGVVPLDRGREFGALAADGGRVLPFARPDRRAVALTVNVAVDARGGSDPAALEAAVRRGVDAGATAMLRRLDALVQAGEGAA